MKTFFEFWFKVKNIWCRRHRSDNWLKLRVENRRNVISACFESILYVRSERRQCFDARFDLKNIAMKNDENDETNEQLIANFFKIWYVVLSVKNRKFEFLDE